MNNYIILIKLKSIFFSKVLVLCMQVKKCFFSKCLSLRHVKKTPDGCNLTACLEA